MKGILISIGCIYLFNSCCDSDTLSISGYVTDAVTGEFIDSAYLTLLGYYNGTNSIENNGFSNKSGYYDISINGEYLNSAGLKVYKLNYALGGANVDDCDIKKNIQLQPLDSYMRIKIYNNMNFGDSIFVKYYTKYMPFTYTQGNGFKETIIKGDSLIKYEKVTGNNIAYIDWEYFFPDKPYCCLHRDSIYLSRGDTVTFIINM